MVFTNHITHHTGRFLVGFVPVVVQLAHGKQYAPVHRLKAIANIWQRSANYNAHGIVEV